MKKNTLHVLLATLCGVSSAFASDNSSSSDNAIFQGLDNQIALGYSYNIIKTYNPSYSGSNVTTHSNNLNLHLEELFDNNIWASIDGSFAFKAHQNSPGGVGFSDNTQEFGFPASISAKGGYSFNWAAQGLQVIPYATIGRMLNYNGMTIIQNGFTNSYLNLYGGGVRLEYAFEPNASIFFDQGIAYLQDPNSGSQNQDSMSYSSVLGVKYNVTPYFQLGVQGMFNQTNTINSNAIGYNPVTLAYQNTAQSSYGGMINFAYLFDSDQKFGSSRSGSASTARNTQLANFDNSYSLGWGWVKSHNSYSGGSLPTIDSTMNYLDFNVTHLFENNVWANINAQLLNNVSQSNVPSGHVNELVPSYIGFPGSVVGNAGYGFQLVNGLQIIPYGSAGIVMNMNSYDIRSNTSITNAIAQDMYLQYGVGGRIEYAFNDFWQIYGDQLLAYMKDQSQLSINALRSTSTLGIKINPGSTLQLGLKGFYDAISPQGNAYSSISNGYVAAQQNSLGVQFDIGLRY